MFLLSPSWSLDLLGKDEMLGATAMIFFDHEYACQNAKISMMRIAENNVKKNLGLNSVIELLNQANWEAPL